MNRMLVPAALVVALVTLSPAQDAKRLRSHLGVEVTQPKGFEPSTEKPKPTTAIQLQESKGGPLLVINTLELGEDSNEATLFQQLRDTFETEGKVVELKNGRYLRIELELEQEDGTKTLNRCYAGYREGRVYYFFLSRTSPEDFKRLTGTFRSFVESAEYFPPEKKKPAPDPVPDAPETPADDEPDPAPPKPTEGDTPKPEMPEKGQPESGEPEKGTGEPEKESGEPEKGPGQPEKEPGEPEKGKEPTSKPAKGSEKAAGSKPKARLLKRASLRLVSFDSEYDPDHWAARNLVDGSPTSGWCSSPGSKAPHTFVFDLGTPQRLARFEFDAACADQGEYAGVGAKAYQIEGSLKGPDAGFKPIHKGELAKGKNDQAVDLPPTAAARWLRLTLTSNHGHASLTELMELRAFSRGPLGFHLERARLSRKRNGAAHADPFKAGDRVWVNFKPRGLTPNNEGKVWLSVDLVLENAEGKEILTREKVVDHVGKPPARPLSQFVSLYVTVPKGFPPGNYAVRLLARDGFGEASAAARLPFSVGK